MSPGEHLLRAALKPRYMNYNHAIHLASEEIISQRIALKPKLYIHIITVIIHPNNYITSVRDGQPPRTTASVYVSGLLRSTCSYLGWLCRTTPDYVGLLLDYFEPRRTTSGLPRSARPDTGVLGTSPEGRPGPRGNHLLDFCLPCAGSVHLRLPD